MTSGIGRITEDIASAPLGDIIASVGEGVAAAQQALDEASIEATLAIYDEGGDERAQFLREIGYRPTFYALPETTGEVTISLALGGQADRTANRPRPGLAPGGLGVVGLARGSVKRLRPKLYATPVDAAYKNRFEFSGDIAAKLSFKIVPVPAPNGLDEVRAVPNFVGLTAVDAGDLASSFDLTLDVQIDDGADPAVEIVVTSQDPEPGTVVTAGSVIVVVIDVPADS